MYTKIFFSLVLLGLVAGCSSKELYGFGTDLGKQLARCDQQITAADRHDCHASRSQSFEHYQADRAALESESTGKVQ